MFVNTRASDYVIKCLQENSCLTLTAPSGVGKTFIARHTALVLQKEGYKIIPVYSPTDIRTYYQPGKKTVFIIDDICGNFTANQQQIENWENLLPVINTIIADTCCKIIVSCRLQVYKDDKFNILLPFKSCECNLISKELRLTSSEKKIIAKTYITKSVDNIAELSQNCEFFPLLCSLYHGEKNKDVKEFFKNPFDVYKKELDNLSRHGDEGNYKICSLALCVLFNNNLKEKWFQGKVTAEQRNILEDTCDACDINRSSSKSKLKKALDTLDGTFICYQNGVYRTIHDKLFDFLAHYFGLKMIDCLIDHGDSDLLHERFIWQKSPDDKNSDIDFIIELPDEYLELYSERFIKDWSAGVVRGTMKNNNMAVSIFRNHLLSYLKTLDKSQQATLVNTKDTVLQKGHRASGTYPLIEASNDGYTDMVLWMLHNNVTGDQCRDDGATGLLMASMQGHTDIVKLLLRRNYNVNLRQKDGSSPLFLASKNGHTDIVMLLLKRYSVVNLCHKDGRSPLLMASQNGHTGIVRILLEKNHEVDLCDKNGTSSLLIASQNGYVDIVRLLLERNPNVDLCNINGCSPLNMACQNGHTDIVRLLLEKNPNVDLFQNDSKIIMSMVRQKRYNDVVSVLAKRNPYVGKCHHNGRSPLYMASLKGHTDIVKLLLERNPNVDLNDYDGCSPLYMACQNGNTDIVRLLLERNPNVDLNDYKGCSPLYMACQNGHTDIVRLLLEKKPNIDLCDKNGITPLIVSCISENTSIVQLLMKYKADINAQTNIGGNALYFSALNGSKEIIKLLLENNADHNICIHSIQSITDTFTNHPSQILDNEKQKLSDSLVKNISSHVANYISKKSVDYACNVVASSSPLHIACFIGRVDVVYCLLNSNADINITKEDGTTPLFYACEVGHEDTVRLLLDKGANTQMCKLDGKSPCNIAFENGHTSVVMILTEHLRKEENVSS